MSVGCNALSTVVSSANVVLSDISVAGCRDQRCVLNIEQVRQQRTRIYQAGPCSMVDMAIVLVICAVDNPRSSSHGQAVPLAVSDALQVLFQYTLRRKRQKTSIPCFMYWG